MKNFLFATLLTIAFSASAFADPIKVNSLALNNFNSEFKQAADVSWIIRKEFSKAEFTMNNRKMEAFYNKQGELIATSENITLNELPVNAKRTFAKRFEGFTVKEAIRFNGLEDNGYYISAENDKESVILRVNDQNNVSVYSKTKK